MERQSSMIVLGFMCVCASNHYHIKGVTFITKVLVLQMLQWCRRREREAYCWVLHAGEGRRSGVVIRAWVDSSEPDTELPIIVMGTTVRHLPATLAALPINPVTMAPWASRPVCQHPCSGTGARAPQAKTRIEDEYFWVRVDQMIYILYRQTYNKPVFGLFKVSYELKHL